MQYAQPRGNRIATALCRAALAVAIATCLPTGTAIAQTAETTATYNIPAGDLATALDKFSTQSGLQLLYRPELVGGKRSPAVSGTLAAPAVLERLLKGSGLTWSRANARTYVLKKAPDPPKAPASKPEQRTEAGETKEEVTELETIVVTGTHIRGAAPTGSPLHVIERDEIDRAGFTTAPQLIKSLPQNFAGDANAELVGTDGGNTNVTGGTGVNLRGLGSSATLTLLDGRRLTQSSGLVGEFVDITSIPMTAIERVEVLTDGASAIYGSDAIAGVVNFVLRRDYEGAETRLSVGADTTGGGRMQYQLGQTWGRSWDGGNALLTYEYSHADALSAMDRSYVAHSDRRASGGQDFRRNFSNPGTIIAPALAGIPSGQDGSGLSPEDLLLGQSNLLENALGLDILREEERHNIFLTARQTLSESIELFGSALFARRDFDQNRGGEERAFAVPSSHPYFVSPVPGATSVQMRYNFIDDFGPRQGPGKAVNYSAVLGGTYDFRNGWRFELAGAYAREENERLDRGVDLARLNEALGFDNPATPFNPAVDGYFNPFADGSNTPRNVLDYVFSGGNRFESWGEGRSLDAKFDGPLFELPGGSVKGAIGGQYRREHYGKDVFVFADGSATLAQGNSADEIRNISSLFAEMTLPLFGKGNARTGLQKLEISGAIRHERYSDFGTSTNPKFGMVWSPLQGLALRGTWGTSFKAPDLQNLIPSGQFFFTTDFPDPASPSGFSSVFYLTGSNPQLEPETSTARTFGLDFRPAFLPGFNAGITYFEISFENRIGTIPGVALSNVALFAPVLTFDPDPALLQSLFDSPYFFGNFASGPPTVVIDDRLRNLATTDVAGFDVTLSYDVGTSIGDLNFALNGNYISKFAEAVSPSAPYFDTVNTVNHPVDLRVRASAQWTSGAYGAFAYVNYSDGYRDTESLTPRKVGSWTTVDLTLRYTVPAGARGLFANAAVSLNAQNLFDVDPPLVNNLRGYDAANASAIGRMVSLNITKEW